MYTSPRSVTATIALTAVCAIACGPVGDTGGGGDLVDAGGPSAPVGSGTERPTGPAAGSGGGPEVDGSPSAAVPDSGTTPVTTISDAAPSVGNGYTVEGSTVFDAAHRAHLFHGVDRPSLEWNPAGEHLSQGDYATMASWKANVVRIALNQDFWLPDSPMHDPGYMALVDEQVQWAEAAGLDVILDLHWSDKGVYSQVPAQQRMADSHSSAFWTLVAGRYKADGHILFELYNEPHDVSWEVWLNGGASGDGFTVVGMQALYDGVRATGAENLVVVGGLQYAYDLSGVQTHRVRGHNLIYATHPYNQNGKQPSNWDTGFGGLSVTDPVMATEFGDATSCRTDYDSAFLAYANAHHISWSAWAWFVSDCKFPSIIADWSGTPNAAGAIVKTALASY